MKYSKSKMIQQLSCYILFVIFFLCTLSKVHAQGSVNDALEIAALKALYEQTGNLDPATGVYKTEGGWRNKWPVAKPSDWNSITSLEQMRDWWGLYVNPGAGAAGYDITGIYLFNNLLTGKLPAELGNLERLAHIDVGVNQLEGPIPAALFTLPIWDLTLYYNNFSGPIPDLTPLASTLEVLKLSNNSFEGNIPSNFSLLTSLRILHLEYNLLSGNIPDGLATLPLERISVQHNSLYGTVPSAFAEISTLRTIELSDNDFTSIPNFSNHPHKEDLHIKVAYNYLDFGSLEQNLSAPDVHVFKYFYYKPQKRFPSQSVCLPSTATKVVNNRGGGANTTYEWYGSQDGATFTSLGITTRDLTLNSATSSYRAFRCLMRSSYISGEELYSSTFDRAGGAGVIADDLEISALKALYEQTGNLDPNTGTYYGTGTGWANKWPVSSPEDWENLTTYDVFGWHGLTVSCGDVTEIDLEDNNLSGSIPSELRHLTGLTDLQLDINNIGGSIPSELGELLDLRRLNLRNNSLTGPIPATLATLPSLEILGLQYNNLSEDIPPQLGDMQSLLILHLYNNNLTGWNPGALFAANKFPKLTIFYADNNALGGQLPSSVNEIANLQVLSLDNVDLTGPIPGTLGDLPLAALTLSNNNLTGSIPSGFNNFSNSNLTIRLENNLLDNIATGFETSGTLSGDYIQNNMFDFGDLERLFTSSGTLPLGAIRYAPQKTVLSVQNTDITINEGDRLEIPFAPTGAQNIYRWEKWNGSGWSAITGATSAAYVKAVAALGDAGRYRCRVTNNWVTKTSQTYQNLILYSEEVTVTVVERPDPPVASGKTICSGQNATLTAVGSGTIKWYNSSEGGSVIFTGPSFTTPSLTVDRTYYVSQTVSGVESYRTIVSVAVEIINIAATASSEPSCSGVSNGIIAVRIDGEKSATYNYEIRNSENVLVASGTANNGQEFLVQVSNGIHIIEAINPDILCAKNLSVDVHSCEGNVSDAVEIAALKALYESTGSYATGEGWNNKWPVTDANSWNSLTSLDQLCGWTGLTFACGDITAIDLPNNAMQGALPEELGNLLALEAFKVQDNILTSLPGTFNNLTSLKTLNLSNNSFSNFPEVILALPNLEFLNLIGNSIPNIPSTIGTAAFSSTLKTFAIGSNEITDVPESIGGLSSLEFLGFGRNKITSVPETLLNLGSLNQLFLTENQLTAIPNFRNHPNKTNLRVHVQRNYLDFPSLEQNLTGPGVSDLMTFSYSPQNNFDDYIEFSCNTTTLVNDRAGGNYTHYKWLGSDDETQWGEVAGGTTADLDLSGGILFKYYKCEMINDRATGVTLYSSVFQRAPEGNVPDAIEIAALKALYESTGSYVSGEGWSNKWPVSDATSWNSLTSVEQLSGWYGLSFGCGDIIEINLSNNGLQGDIPAEFSGLSALTLFDASMNSLGSLPSTFNNLTLLKELNLSYNSFSNFPAVILELPALEFLNLIGNSIETIPSTIGAAAFSSTLTSFAIGTNLLTEIPESIGNLSSLEFLGFFDNQITNVPETILNITTLERVIITRNKISSIPNFRDHPNRVNLEVYVHENYIDFVSLEQNLTGPGVSDLAAFVYVPQFNLNNTTPLSCEIEYINNDRGGGNYTNYQWLWSDDRITWSVVNGATSEDLVFAGEQRYKFYQCRMTNDFATGIELYSSTYVWPTLANPVIFSATPVKICYPESEVLTVSGGYSKYQWYFNGTPIPDATMNSLVVDQSGAYFVVACGYESNVVTVKVYQAPAVTIVDNTPTTCQEASDGGLTFNINQGTGSYAYEVRDADNSIVLSGNVGDNTNVLVNDLASGNYTISVEDTGGSPCSLVNRNFTIQNGGPITSLCASSMSCIAAPDGSESSDLAVTVNRLRGTGDNYNYEIRDVNNQVIRSGTGIFNTEISPKPTVPYTGEDYTFYVLTGADNTCPTTTTTFSVEKANLLVTTDQPIYKKCATNEEVTVSLLPSLSSTSCTELPEPYFNITVEKDGEPFETLTSVQEPIELNIVPAGEYTVTLSGQYGAFSGYFCNATTSFTIEDAYLAAEVVVTQPACNDPANDGRATARVTGGSGPYSYKWYEGTTLVSTLPEVTGLDAGTYRLELRGRYCENPYVEEFDIVAPSPIGTATIQPPVGNCDMSATLSPAGGVGPYDFYWITMEEVQQLEMVYDPLTQKYLPEYTTSYQEKIAFVDRAVAASGGSAVSFTTTNVVKPGEIKVRVVDAKGCEVESTTVTIEQPAFVRNYDICFRWKTPAAPEQNEPDPNINVISNTMISSRSMSKAVMAQAEECVSGKVAEFGAAYDAYCLSTDFLNDEVSFSYDIATYHHTLYYYDRAGKLVRTVPPKGVNPLLAGDLSRTNTPSHSLITNYNYNNLGQLVRQSSPDGGQSKFIYNNLGQLRFSQNANQLNASAISYTKYDELGRPLEVGEADLGITYTTPGGATFPTNTFDDLNQETFLDLDKETYQTLPVEARYPTAAHGLSEQTITIYNESAPGIDYNGEAQSYLRNRVSYTEHINKSGEKVSTYYSYDPHGNVKWLSQEVPGLGVRKVGYDYDLLSGNVVKVKYNEGEEDQFFHKYAYDEDNRIKEVFTSRNNLIWERDAAYEYFGHGPLKRAVIGDNAVQGLDYAYTIHGWLKALNNPSDPADPAGKDAFGMTLGYYAGDFNNNGSPFNSTANDNNLPAKLGRELFNGNISSWQLANLASDGSWMRGGYQYEYDQLNRIRNSEFSILKEGTFYNRSGFHADFTLDPNGNLETLNRNDIDGERMDAFQYHLIAGTNKLEYVDDNSTIEVDKHKNDLEDQAAGNYVYDAIGNLVRDNQEGIDIDWTVYGKVKSTQKADGSGTDFLYDAAGNRVVKKTLDEHGNVMANYYVRDASGNVMAIYKEQVVGGSSELNVQEIPIYGSDRLGMYKPEGSGANGTQVKTQVTQNRSVNSYEGVSYDVAKDIELSLEPGFVFEGGVDGNKFTVGNTSQLSTTDPVVLLDKKVYELKDHLGNVRAVISDRKVGDVSGSTPQDVKPAILSASAYYPYGMDMPTVKWGEETYTATYDNPVEEFPDFLNYGDAQRVELYDHTGCGDCIFSQQLTAGAGSIIGLARSLKVQAGDQVNMEVYGRYTDPAGTDPSDVAVAIGSAFINAFNVPATYEGYPLQDHFNTLFADGSWIDDGNTLPVKAYLNYLLYDNTFTLVKLGAMPLTDAAATLHERLAFEVPIEKDGYIYIYLSNESEVITPVYFDDFKITHKKLVPDVDLSGGLIAYRYGFNGKEKDQSGEWGGVTYELEGTILDDEFDNTTGWEINNNVKPTAENPKGESWCCGDAVHTSGTLSLVEYPLEYPTGAARKAFTTEVGGVYRATVRIFKAGAGGKIWVLENEPVIFNTGGDYEIVFKAVGETSTITVDPNESAMGTPTLVEAVSVVKLAITEKALGLAHYDYGFRIYNPAIGRFLSVDPLTRRYPMLTPYQFAGNTPIWAIDLDGLEPAFTNNGEGKPVDEKGVVLEEGSERESYDWNRLSRGRCKSCRSETWIFHEGSEYYEQGFYSESAYEYTQLKYDEGQVLPEVNYFEYYILEGGASRSWNGYQVDENGYLTGEIAPISIDPFPATKSLSVATGTKTLLNGMRMSKGAGLYTIYRGLKKVKVDGVDEYFLYIGKAKNGIKARYSAGKLSEYQIEALNKLKKLPDNPTALGVEQHIMELNGWLGKASNKAKPVLSNVNNATVKEIYKKIGLDWLNKNVPDWKEIYKFQ